MGCTATRCSTFGFGFRGFRCASPTAIHVGPLRGHRAGLKALAEGAEKEALKAVEKTKASVRAFVEHPFHLVKNLFRHRKERYRGLAKNGQQLYTLFGLANVVLGARTRATA